MFQEVHVARQAIYDRDNRPVAYELLFRALPDATCSLRNDELASWQVLSAGFLDIGLDSLLNGRRALVNVPRNMLLDERIYSLPADVIGLEILEDVVPDGEVLDMCRALRARGYLLVLDDYIGQAFSEPLLDVIDWVKVDLRALENGDSAKLARALKRRNLRLLAEKVETEEERDMALAAGYDYFQGYFLHRPKVVGGRSLTSNLQAKLKLLQLLGSSDFSLNKVRAIIESDVGLCYRLIQYSNSVRFGARHAITGLRQCLMRLGEDETRRWITIALLPTLAPGGSSEVTESALTRARMCELLTKDAGPLIFPAQAFMAGMFTLMDAVLRLPKPEVVEQLGLSKELSDALLHRGESALGTLLQLVEAYESCLPEELQPLCEQLGVTLEAASDAYIQALQWTAEVTGVQEPALQR
ncbi:EAL and HDOD domain-containing protein [Paludibaculum fermentans]|uniref:HDOD domain-containing protein n=1 Tax=Paludibaculum fermentans TaxID=1473598 RepID=A0A7S7NV05_PALFE|nr:HDOD domain-containing protein [Paludibaculum fermentans]QOY90238.1 HDOD domain-containing protein [Paludibaculum fermentans]